MTAMGTQACDGSPCAFQDPVKDLLIVVYGNDYVVVGLTDVLLDLETELAKHLSMTRKVSIRHEEGDDKGGRILNRIISLEDDWLLWEADPRHVEMIIRELCLETATPQTTPKSSRDDLIETEALKPEADGLTAA